MKIWTNLLQICNKTMAKLRNIIQVEDPNKLPEDVDDARLLAGLIGHVANESVAICKNIDPSAVPGGMDSTLSENTRGLVDDFNELKSKKYRVPTTTQSNNVSPVSTSAPVVHSIPQPTVSTTQPTSSDSSQLELDLTPSESKQIINTLEGIESVLNKIYKLMVKFDERVVAKKVKKS
nr:MAG TPA: hypothetical protein [Caudoviricetes sp.]